ncbi:hypothetical protein J1614_010995 [Plenodomus biglobosus]|nr:hypothetical protein J1614_010995 [Plenodomus biglobosus]
MAELEEKPTLVNAPLYILPAPYPGPSNCHSDPSDEKQPVAGGGLRKQIEKLVKAFERMVDQQVLAAQIRAYDTSLNPHNSLSKRKAHWRTRQQNLLGTDYTHGIAFHGSRRI